MTARYLGQAAVARELNAGEPDESRHVTRHMIGTWRSRYKDSATPFPEPDAWTESDGDGRDIPGWLPARLPEIRAWRASLPGQGKGGGRPRKDADS